MWGSVLNMSKTVILSTCNMKNNDDWLDDYLMEDAPANVALYLGIWISLRNNTWNQHYNKTLSKARKAFFFLRSIGLRRQCLPPEESIALFKILILPKLTYGAEVIMPSEAVVRKVDAFLGYCVKSLLGLNYDSSTQEALWEANVPSFEFQLKMARLRFHWKLTKGPLSARFGTSYKEGNFLYDANIPLLEEWKAYREVPLIPGKYAWKHWLSEACVLLRRSAVSKECPFFFALKPNECVSTRILSIHPIPRAALLRGRHLLPESLDCTCGKNGFSDQPVHVLTECVLGDVYPKRMALQIRACMIFPNQDFGVKASLYRTLVGGGEPAAGHAQEYARLLEAVCTLLLDSGLGMDMGNATLT
jgi:hypothetical protein